MSGQVTAAIIAFAAGVIVASLNGLLTQRLENRKLIARLASDAFIDAMKALADNAQAHAALSEITDSFPAERMSWQSRVFETNAEYASAKARLATYGNKRASHLLAGIERAGGFAGRNTTVQELIPQVVLALRTEMGFAKNDISKEDITALLFGSPQS